MSEGRDYKRTLEKVAALVERECTIEQIAHLLSTSLKRAKALVNEIQRQKAILK